jgi:tetratricopeptide (TPR) repeat protein
MFPSMFAQRSKSAFLAAVIFVAAAFTGCGVFGPKDETAAAAALVQEANQDLKKIKELYDENEGDVDQPGKREQLKKALEENDAAQVRKISDDVVYIIGDGMGYAKTAIEKIQQAQDMNVNEEYKEYLRLKESALSKQVEAFEHYRQAARALRDNYDPKNEALRARVKTEFDDRSEKYRELMEQARDFSSQANELAKDAIRKQAQGN